MSASDAPPGVPFAGRAFGEFVARRRPRRLAGRVLFIAVVAGAATAGLMARRIHSNLAEVLLMLSMLTVSVACVGYAVRRAHVRIDAEGVRWGWELAGFRMGRARLREIRAYDDAVAFAPRRGSTWYICARDWEQFDRLPAALRRAAMPFALEPGRAPLGARLQSYGAVLDGLLLLDAVAAVLALAVALVA